VDLGDLLAEDEPPQVEVVDGAVEERAAGVLTLRLPPDLQVEDGVREGAADGLDAAEPAAPHDLSGALHVPVAAEVVADEHPERRARGALDDPVGLLERRRERLLEEEVLARVERGDRELGVRGRRRADRDRVDRAVAEQRLDVDRACPGPAPSGLGRALRRGVRDRDDLDLRHVPERRQVPVERDVPAADDPEAHAAILAVARFVPPE
jgi:hypothetical protein